MNRIDKSTRITVITGAGFSQASGVPTFRGKDGLWRNYDASELATPNAFRKNPGLVWEWYHWRINLILNVEPNQAHHVLASWERKGGDISILTQNVDDLHERAGSRNVIHLHGEIRESRCPECGDRSRWTLETLEKTKPIPDCLQCGSIIRPNVVWFGESLDPSIIEACLKRLSSTEVLIVAGTSGVVYPVANFPYIARQENPNIEIFEFNMERTPISGIATQTILGPVDETLGRFFTILSR
ncbi:MAG: NAD-dependent deacylase [Candidatus Thorarchaeota archaeon]